jgi:hypothetical protein
MQLEVVEQLENACPTSSNPVGSVKRDVHEGFFS